MDKTNYQENKNKPKKTIGEELISLKQTDENLYNIISIDVWALAKTMDEFQPGFWSAFMKNRDLAMKNFIREIGKNKSSEAIKHPFFR
jgi:hypothetical protein